MTTSKKKNTMLFSHHYQLDEAASLLPEIKAALNAAYQDFGKVRDDIVLYKRLHMAKRKQPMGTDGTEMDVLQKKYAHYEEKVKEWVRYFEKKSIFVRDFDQGVVEFPYKSSEGEEFLLSWHYGEEGILYFFLPQDGPEAKLPITVLPD